MNFRLRLALWYGALLAVVAGATLLLAYYLHSASMYLDVDRSLVSSSSHLLADLNSHQAQGETFAGAGVPLVQQFASPDTNFRLFDETGTLVATSASADALSQVDPQQILARDQGPASVPVIGRLLPGLHLAWPHGAPTGAFETADAGQGRSRLYASPVTFNGRTQGYLEAGSSLALTDHAMSRLRLILGAVALAGIAIALGGGWMIAGGALRPIASLTQTARAIALSRGFSRRLPEADRRDEVGRLATAFNEMLASLEAAYRSQQRFVADASHELRAPLTVLQGNLELLRDRKDMSPADREASLRAVEAEAARMGNIVADLLSLARAEAGETLRVETVELDRLAVDAVRDAALLKPGIAVEAESLEPVTIRGDGQRLAQVIRILIDNATRYTESGGRVGVSVGTEDGFAVLSVSDTGIGISSEDAVRIFEPFFRTPAARAHDPEGTGLGLAIARSIVDRHRGHISVASEPGKGTRFIVQLPLDATQPAAGRAQPASAGSPASVS